MLHFAVTCARPPLFPLFPSFVCTAAPQPPSRGCFSRSLSHVSRFQVIIPLADALKAVPGDGNHRAKASKPCPRFLPLQQLLRAWPACPLPLARPLLPSHFPGGDRNHAGPVPLPLASHKRILQALESAEQRKELGPFGLGKRDEAWARR